MHLGPYWSTTKGRQVGPRGEAGPAWPAGRGVVVFISIAHGAEGGCGCRRSPGRLRWSSDHRSAQRRGPHPHGGNSPTGEPWSKEGFGRGGGRRRAPEESRAEAIGGVGEVQGWLRGGCGGLWWWFSGGRSSALSGFRRRMLAAMVAMEGNRGSSSSVEWLGGVLGG